MELILSLCEGRHEMPSCVQGSVFPNQIDPLDLNGLYYIAESRLKEATHVTLYVTGLTVALIECIKVCLNYNIGLTLMHFDRDTGNYYTQEVVSRKLIETCSFCGKYIYNNELYCSHCGKPQHEADF